jgi:hypothetical protein
LAQRLPPRPRLLSQRYLDHVLIRETGPFKGGGTAYAVPPFAQTGGGSPELLENEP